jgi:hypothetical protein
MLAFFIYSAATNNDLRKLVLLFSPLILFRYFQFFVNFLNEEIIWEDGRFLKKYTPKILFWMKFSPLPADDIVGFVENSKEEWKFMLHDKIIQYDIYVLLKKGESIPILKSIKSDEAYKGVRALSNGFSGGNLKLHNSFTKEYYNNIITRNYPNVSNIDEFSALLKRLTNELLKCKVNKSASAYEIKAINLLYYLKMNRSITRYVLSEFTYDEHDQLGQIYVVIAKSFQGWEEFILTEICRLFDDARESNNAEMLRTLEVFTGINQYWRGEKFHKFAKSQLESYTSSPSEKIRIEATKLLSQIA